MLPYLGPEIIAVIQAALRSASSHSRRHPSFPFVREGKDTIILSLTCLLA